MMARAAAGQPRDKRTLRIVVAGAFGCGNIGDDAIAASVVDQLRGLDLPVSITLLSGSPKETALWLDVETVSLRRRKYLPVLLHSDFCICGGGGLIDDGDLKWLGLRGMLATFFFFTLVAKMRRIPVVFVAVGAEPFRSRIGRLMAKTMLNLADLILVRDVNSQLICEGLGVKNEIHVTADIALLYNQEIIENGARDGSDEGPLIGINVHSDIAEATEDYRNSFAEIINTLGRLYSARILFVPTWPKDIEASEMLVENLDPKISHSIVSVDSRPDEVMAAISKCDLFVGTRLHPCILASLVCVPIVGFARYEKVSSFLARAGQECIIARDHLNVKEAIGVIGRVLVDRELYRKNLRRSIEKMKGEARRNTLMVNELLQRELQASLAPDSRELSEDIDAIVCMSPDIWGDVKRPQQLMQIMSRSHKVAYIEPPVYIASLLRSPATQLLNRAHRTRWKRALTRRGFVPNDNICVYTPLALVPRHYLYKLPLRGFVRAWESFGDRRLAAWTRKALDRMGVVKPLFWFGAPERDHILSELAEHKVVYDCVDRWSDFPGPLAYPEWRLRLERSENFLLERADAVFCSARSLLESKKGQAKNRIALLQNGADIAHFRTSLQDSTITPSDIRDIRTPIIGYFGAIASWLDFSLLRELAVARPKWSIVLIGPLFSGAISGEADELDLIKPLTNVHLLGSRRYEDLPGYLKAFDVAIIPFKVNALTEDTNPIKVYEYLAAGKPVVSTPLPEVQALGAVEIGRDSREFIALIDGLLQGELATNTQSRLRLAQENSWEKRVAFAWEFLQGSLVGKKALGD